MVQSGNYGITAFRLPNTPSESYSKEETREANMTEYEVKLYCFQWGHKIIFKCPKSELTAYYMVNYWVLKTD